MGKDQPQWTLTDVAKSMESLTEKITRQNCLIEAQNTLVQEQQHLIENQKKVVEELIIKLTALDLSMCAPPAATIGKTDEKEAPQSIGTSKSTASPTNKSDRARRAASRATKPTVERAGQRVQSTSHTTSKKKTIPVIIENDSCPLADVESNSEEIMGPLDPTLKEAGKKTGERDGWQEVRRNKKKPKSNIVVGTCKEECAISSAPRVKYIQAWSFKPDTTESQVRNFLHNIVSGNYTVEKREIKTDRHAAFVIGIPEPLYPRITTPTSWPHGIRFCDWFLGRSRQGTTSPAPAAARAPSSVTQSQ